MEGGDINKRILVAADPERDLRRRDNLLFSFAKSCLYAGVISCSFGLITGVGSYNDPHFTLCVCFTVKLTGPLN